MRRIALGFFALLVCVAMLGSSVGSAQAQSSQCFPETGFCISGRFAQYWNQNGGLAVFGYPLSNESQENGRSVQYFERQRFELHSENAAPYDVLLGLLGVQLLSASGIDWTTQPTAAGPVAGCLWFPETKHNVCDQQSGVGFRSYWQSHGLEFDSRSGKSYSESLALFGYPVTEPYTDLIDGKQVQVQWFERARFEWHPDNQNPYKVLLGRLGALTVPGTSQPPSNAYTNRDTPVDLLASFYNAINLGDYGRAYSYWETPPSTYNDFINGYANTSKVQLIVQPPTFIDVGAGNAHSAVPTAIVATQRDGSTQVFAGCYVLHKVNIQPDVWHISQASINSVANTASLPAQLAQACAAYGVPESTQNVFDMRDSPVDVLASLYNAIGRQEYQRAYGYWEAPPSTYDQFVQGYANTSKVQLLVQPPTSVGAAAGNLYSSVPAVLLATLRDGTVQTYSGCYSTHTPNMPPYSWGIRSGTIALAAASATVDSLLRQPCSN